MSSFNNPLLLKRVTKYLGHDVNTPARLVLSTFWRSTSSNNRTLNVCPSVLDVPRKLPSAKFSEVTTTINQIHAIKRSSTPSFKAKKPHYSGQFSSYATKNQVEGLPVLNYLVNLIQQDPNNLTLKDTLIIYVHHALETSFDLLKSFIDLGADPKNIFVLGKSYSQSSRVVTKIKNLGVCYIDSSPQIGLGRFSNSFTSDINTLWTKALIRVNSPHNLIKNAIVMDHGGHALAYTPAAVLKKVNIFGLEKTTAGLINPHTQGLPFPILAMASCAIKKYIESQLIADAIVAKITPLIPMKNTSITCGVVGYGAIGKGLVAKLISMGHKVIVYDQDPQQLKSPPSGMIPTNELAALVASSDYIFGCTGRDIAANLDPFRLCSRAKTLISCSSEDVEFLSLLQINQRLAKGKMVDPLNELIYMSEMGAQITILKGGFPANFDHSGESVPANEIQLTRALVLAGVYQIMQYFKNYPQDYEMNGHIMLDPTLQKNILNEWLKYQAINKYPSKLIEQCQNSDFLRDNSGGNYLISAQEKIHAFKI